jgi:tellurite resistance protein TerC
MLLEPQLEHLGFRPAYSLYVIIGILATSILASYVIPEKKEVEAQP